MVCGRQPRQRCETRNVGVYEVDSTMNPEPYTARDKNAGRLSAASLSTRRKGWGCGETIGGIRAIRAEHCLGKGDGGGAGRAEHVLRKHRASLRATTRISHSIQRDIAPLEISRFPGLKSHDTDQGVRLAGRTSTTVCNAASLRFWIQGPCGGHSKDGAQLLYSCHAPERPGSLTSSEPPVALDTPSASLGLVSEELNTALFKAASAAKIASPLPPFLQGGVEAALEPLESTIEECSLESIGEDWSRLVEIEDGRFAPPGTLMSLEGAWSLVKRDCVFWSNVIYDRLSYISIYVHIKLQTWCKCVVNAYIPKFTLKTVS